MNTRILFIPLLIFLFTLCGCGRIRYPALLDEPIAFQMGTFEDTEHDFALFGTLEYKGRTYIGYGTISDAFGQEDVDQCIGYIVMDKNSSSHPDPNDFNTRVYTLIGDHDHNFLMDYDNTAGLMNQPSFWRAIDTKGKKIEIPQCVDDLGYDYWK